MLSLEIGIIYRKLKGLRPLRLYVVRSRSHGASDQFQSGFKYPSSVTFRSKQVVNKLNYPEA